MRRLLNRPWFVALLALAALVAVGQAVFSGAKHRAPATPAEESPADGLPAETETGPRLGVREAIKALPLPAAVRDPFAPHPKPADTAPDSAPTPAAATVDRLRLGAIWIQGSDTLMLLNGRICQPGDTVGNFTVESADIDGVWVRHPAGRSLLSVGRELAVTNCPPEPAPAAPPSP